MPSLSAAQIEEVLQEISEELSANNVEIPITKPQGRQLLGLIDDELDSAEGDVINHPGVIAEPEIRNWLIANTHISRQFIERVEAKRREVL